MAWNFSHLARIWRELFRPAVSPPSRPQPRAHQRLLIVRPDTYGDLILFEPAVRALLEALPEAEVALLVRRGYADLAPLFPPRLRWLRMDCEPYRSLPSAQSREVDQLRHVVEDFDPDQLIGGCYSSTWVEYLAAAFAPRARRARLGDAPLEIGSAQAVVATLNGLFPSQPRVTVGDLERLFPDRVALPEELPEVAKGHALVAGLTGRPASQEVPQLHLSAELRQEMGFQLKAWHLEKENYLVICPAGTANVAIKAWPSTRFGEVIAWAEKTLGLPSLILGGAPERPTLEETAAHARSLGAQRMVVHAGERGTFPQFAALLGLSRAYVGNDTGALHAAAATGRAVLGVFGGGTWPRFRPAVSGAGAAVLQPMECFGCGWDCPFGDAPCLASVPVGLVQEALTWLLSSDAVPGVCRNFELRSTAGEVESRFLRAARLHRQVRAESAARQRQIAELQDRLHRPPPPAPAVPGDAPVIPVGDQRDQVLRLRAEVRRLEAELRVTRRLLASFVAEPPVTRRNLT